jgi:hypothetical protein
LKTLNAPGQALLDRAIAGENIPMVQLLEVALTVPQFWAVCGIPLVWNSQTWAPLDVQVGEVNEEASGFNGLTFTLPGITPSQLALAFDDVDEAVVRMYVALVDPDTGVVADAFRVWSGALDIPGWQGGQEAAVIFAAEHRGMLSLRVRPTRYTNDEQQRLHAGDTCFDYDPATDAEPFLWPTASFFKV